VLTPPDIDRIGGMRLTATRNVSTGSLVLTSSAIAEVNL
jgi:hypothetical protein